VLTRNVRGVFDRVAEMPEPFDVHSSSAKQPSAVLSLEDAKEVPAHDQPSAVPIVLRGIDD
jgi:hypothetical protein